MIGNPLIAKQMLEHVAEVGLHLPVRVYVHEDERGQEKRMTASPRDEKVPPLRGVAGRLDRALRNFVETFPLFATVVLVAHVSDTHNALTVLGAQLYFWGRLAYVVLYAAGVPVIRSLVWNVATVGILLFVAALFLR